MVCDEADDQDLPEEKVPERVRRAAGGFRQLQVQLLASEQAMHEGVARFYLDDTEGDARTAKQRLSMPPLFILRSNHSLQAPLLPPHATDFTTPVAGLSV